MFLLVLAYPSSPGTKAVNGCCCCCCFLLEMGIPKHLVALVQALCAQQTAKVRWDRESSEAFTIGKESSEA